MDTYVTGSTIRRLREQKRFTQKQLADLLEVSAKTVSKWETGHGLPDISLLEPLARVLGVSLASLFSGEFAINGNKNCNLLKSFFYVCPICGNAVYSIGESSVCCCGVTLPRLEAEEPDEKHQLRVDKIEYENYVTLKHPMTREHHISFLACLTQDRLQFLKLYPEQEAEGRFSITGSCRIYAYCNRHGLFAVKAE